MISSDAANFILNGLEGEYFDDETEISITKESPDIRLEIVMKNNRISGNLLEAYIDEFGDLSLIFPELDIKLPVDRGVPA